MFTLNIYSSFPGAALIVALSLGIVGCGADNTAEKTHYADGKLKVADAKHITLETASGKSRNFLLRASDRGTIKIAKIQALISAEESVRVTYEVSGGKDYAVKVGDAPNPFAKLPSVEGNVVAVDQRQVSVKTDAGETVVLSIRKEDHSRMEPDHIKEDHMDTGEPIRIFYEETGDKKFARSFEDA